MEKNRIIKIIILIVLPIVFLTGCIKWEDVKKTVGEDNIKNGTTCTYYAGTEKYNNIEQISFYINNNGLYVSFDKSQNSFIVGPNSKKIEEKHTYSGTEYEITQSFLEGYFNSYKANGGCPRTIYVDGRKNSFYMVENSAVGDPIKHVAYTIEPTKAGDSTCHNQNVSVCNNKCYAKDSLIGSTCFEWGYEKDGNPYFWISKNGTFSSYVAMNKGITGSMIAETDNGWLKYEIAKQSIGDIWLGNNNIISASNLDINREQNTEFTSIFIFKKGKSIGTGTKSDGEEQTIDGGKIGGGGGSTTPAKIPGNNVNYTNICGNEGISKVVKLIGMIIYILKFVAPILIIVFGIIDYAKAVTSDDENALNKATSSLIRRLVSAIVIFFIPTILWGILNVLDITDGLHDLNNTEFGSCTRCILKNNCN